MEIGSVSVYDQMATAAAAAVHAVAGAAAAAAADTAVPLLWMSTRLRQPQVTDRLQSCLLISGSQQGTALKCVVSTHALGAGQ